MEKGENGEFEEYYKMLKHKKDDRATELQNLIRTVTQLKSEAELLRIEYVTLLNMLIQNRSLVSIQKE